jgi:hypothetical protein
VRKSIALLHKQAEMLTWLKAVLVAGVVIAAVIALHPLPPPGAGTPTTQTAPAPAATQPAGPN